jgi:type IV fimbrial biogenesis protein FimT
VLIRRQNQRGVTLIEILVGVTIVGILFAVGAPSFSSWLQNTRTRTTAESIQNGLQLARAEAVRRNTLVRFQLTSDMTNGCTLSTTTSYWVVSTNGTNSGDPTGSCDSQPSDTVAPYLIQKRSGNEGSTGVTIVANQGTVAFNGLGWQGSVTNLDASVVTPTNVIFQIPDTTTVTCSTSLRCLQVQVSTTGQIRMCDPALASTDPQGC